MKWICQRYGNSKMPKCVWHETNHSIPLAKWIFSNSRIFALSACVFGLQRFFRFFMPIHSIPCILNWFWIYVFIWQRCNHLSKTNTKCLKYGYKWIGISTKIVMGLFDSIVEPLSKCISSNAIQFISSERLQITSSVLTKKIIEYIVRHWSNSLSCRTKLLYRQLLQIEFKFIVQINGNILINMFEQIQSCRGNRVYFNINLKHLIL